MGSPTAVSAAAAAPPQRVNFLAKESSEERKPGDDDGAGEDSGFRFQQNRPSGLVIGQSPMFTVPPCLLDSPGLFSSGQTPAYLIGLGCALGMLFIMRVILQLESSRFFKVIRKMIDQANQELKQLSQSCQQKLFEGPMNLNSSSIAGERS